MNDSRQRGSAVPESRSALGRYVEESFGGADNVELRGLVTKAIEFAQKVKHDLTTGGRLRLRRIR